MSNQQRPYVYFSTDSGASENQTGFTNGIIQYLPKEVNYNNVKSLVSQTTPGFSDLNPTSNYYNHFVRLIIIITRKDKMLTYSGSIMMLKVYSQIVSIQYLFLHTHITNNTGSNHI